MKVRCDGCPYWERSSASWSWQDRKSGEWKERDVEGDGGICVIRSVETFPLRGAEEWCGEHPEFELPERSMTEEEEIRILCRPSFGGRNEEKYEARASGEEE